MDDGPQRSPHPRECGEPWRDRHADAAWPVGFLGNGPATLEDDFQHCSARQIGYTRRDRQGGGVSRLRRQQLYHGNGIVCGWRFRTSVDANDGVDEYPSIIAEPAAVAVEGHTR